MNHSFKISRAKLLEGLANISKVLRESCMGGERRVVDDKAGTIRSSAAFRNGLVVEYSRGSTLVCPICGGNVSLVEDLFEEGRCVCDDCHAEIPCEVFLRNAMCVSEHGVAVFVMKSLGGQYCRPCDGGNFRLGKVLGRNAFFCPAPTSGFFNAHNENTLVVVCDTSSVPSGWVNDSCKAIAFTELFYEEDDEIHMDDDVLEALRPKAGRRFGKCRRIHPRRDKWLSVIMNIFANKYRPADFKDGMLTPAGAMYWFSRIFPSIKVCKRTFARDLEELSYYDKDKDAYNKTQPQIVRLLELASEQSIPQAERMEYANRIKEELARAKSETNRNGGRMAELSEWGWINGSRGRSERIPTVTDATICANVDEVLRGGKGMNGVAA